MFRQFQLRRYFCVNKNLLTESIKKNISPLFMDVIDESASHMETVDSHFKVYVVSDKFEGLSHIKR